MYDLFPATVLQNFFCSFEMLKRLRSQQMSVLLICTVVHSYYDFNFIFKKITKVIIGKFRIFVLLFSNVSYRGNVKL